MPINSTGPQRGSEAVYLFQLLAKNPGGVEKDQLQALLKKRPNSEAHNKHRVKAHLKFWGDDRGMIEKVNGRIRLTAEGWRCVREDHPEWIPVATPKSL